MIASLSLPHAVCRFDDHETSPEIPLRVTPTPEDCCLWREYMQWPCQNMEVEPSIAVNYRRTRDFCAFWTSKSTKYRHNRQIHTPNASASPGNRCISAKILAISAEEEYSS